MKIENLAFAVAAFHLVLGSTAGCSPAEGPKQRGAPVEDTAVTDLLRPEEPIEKDGLFQAEERTLFYEACLRDQPPSGYLDRYKGLVGRRGVIVEAIGSSPHAIPPRLMGWWTKVVRPGRKKPFTLRYTEFQDLPDEESRKTQWNAPDPFRIEGKCVQVRLGQRRTPWTERVIVPDGDLFPVEELPLRRFPGAILKQVSPKTRDFELLEHASVTRAYVVFGASLENVFRHYEAEARKIGIQVIWVRNGGLSWSGKAEAITQLSVNNQILSVGLKTPLSEARERWPHLFEGFPPDVLEFTVSMYMTDPSVASRYWTPEEQARRAELLKTKK